MTHHRYCTKKKLKNAVIPARHRNFYHQGSFSLCKKTNKQTKTDLYKASLKSGRVFSCFQRTLYGTFIYNIFSTTFVLLSEPACISYTYTPQKHNFSYMVTVTIFIWACASAFEIRRF